MSESIDWDMLQKQFFSNMLYCDTLSKECKIVDSPFACTLSRIPGLFHSLLIRWYSLVYRKREPIDGALFSF